MEHLKAVLTEGHLRLSTNPGLDSIDWLARELGTSFDEANEKGHLSEFRDHCLSHPLSELFLLDPYSRRAFDKPRGYAGDAVMLDYIYRPDVSQLDGLASVVHQATTSLPNAKSILWRRDYLAGLIHDYMTAKECPEVLSVASGHMRELDALRHATARTTVRLTALDQDEGSIAEAKREYHEFDIHAEVGSFMTLVRERKPAKSYDLIYSAGLFDYLPKNSAVALIKAMFARLKSGGMLSIGNFTRNSHGRGFMAGFMDWCLIYRDEADLRDLASKACPTASYRIFRDQPGNVVYIEIYAD